MSDWERDLPYNPIVEMGLGPSILRIFGRGLDSQGVINPYKWPEINLVFTDVFQMTL